MSATNQQKRTGFKQAFWQQHIEGCKGSPLSQEQYCRKHGLALSTFSYWKRKLESQKQEAPRFYPLAIRQHPEVRCQSPGTGLSLQICRDRFRIELEEDFSVSCLKKLIHALEQV